MLYFTKDSVTCVADRILPRDFSHSKSDGGQIQGSIGEVISQSTKMTFFFRSARYLANLTAAVVFPDPGLPQTARTPPWRIFSLPDSSFASREKIEFFLKLIILIPPHQPDLKPQKLFSRFYQMPYSSDMLL